MTPNQPSWSGGAAPPYAPTEQPSYPGTDGGSGSTTEVAKQEAANVAQNATDAAQQVATTAKDQVAGVASEAKDHASRLTGEARQQVAEQASTQKGRAVSGLRSLSQELQGMADSAEQSGPATQVARTASSTADQIASYLDRHEPGQLVDELRDFARRRPGTFLLGAALAGVVAGRLTRGVVSNNSGDSSDQSGGGQPGGRDGSAGNGSSMHGAGYVPPISPQPVYEDPQRWGPPAGGPPPGYPADYRPESGPGPVIP
jgi:hypothetical protein